MLDTLPACHVDGSSRSRTMWIERTPTRVYYELTDQIHVAADVDRAWRFSGGADNLPLITPPWLQFTTAMKTPVTIQQDAELDYTIRWLGVPVRWRTKIIDWSPPRQFIDLQLRGPYSLSPHQPTLTPSPHGHGAIRFDRVSIRCRSPSSAARSTGWWWGGS